MTPVMTTLKEWEDRYLDVMSKVEEPVVEYTGRIAETVAEYMPDRPDWEFLDRVPTMTELVDNQLKFRKRVVDEQAAFVRRMMKAAHPALVKIDKKAPVAAAKATKPARKARAA